MSLRPNMRAADAEGWHSGDFEQMVSRDGLKAIEDIKIRRNKHLFNAILP